MYNTKFVQNNAKASFNQTSETKHLNFTAVVIITAILVMAVALISSSIVAGVDANLDQEEILEMFVKLAKTVIAVTIL
jgi:hypothetical protein